MSHIALTRTGDKMPIVGFGLWKVTKSTCADTVYNAIKAGYRLFDGAGDYGNEKEAGEGVKRAISDGLVKREDLWITSKLWNTYHSKEHVEYMAKYQLGLWGLEYFDLFLIHFPCSLEFVPVDKKYPPEWWGLDTKVHLVNVPYQETWESMEKLVDSGLVKNIGVSNVAGALLTDVLRYARIQPQVNQVELHPYLTQQPLVDYCKAVGIAVTAYSSFGPQGYIELDMDQGAASLFAHSVTTTAANKYKKTPAQVLLRWATQRGVAVIPKSNNNERLVQNLASIDFDLTEEELASISGLNLNLRLNNPVSIHPGLAIFA